MAIHGGQVLDPLYGAVSVPIYQTSTFAFLSAEDGAAKFAGEVKGYKYTRLGNPTVKALEDAVSTLENGYAGLATASGMAAINAVYMTFLSKGDHIVSTDAVYGPSRLLIEKHYSRFGVEYTYVDSSNIELVKKAIKKNTKVLYIETPANPTLAITDIKECAKLAKKHNLILIVDNTFMGPHLQRPLELGADVVVHSMTKSLNGHSDVVAGMIVTKNKELYKQIQAVHFSSGGTIDPNQAWLVLRGIKTMPLRVEKSDANAREVAKFLEKHPMVEWVKYPGLKSHPQHELAKKQMEGFGSMLSFDVKGGVEGGKTVMNNVKIATLAVSLGGIESLIQHPASMTHAAMGQKTRLEAGITDGMKLGYNARASLI
ncbi:MAG TPA: aminotransferase class I/II-fold pyridoxal phosphate-dependent enzyme, partial [Candidatus Wallbacteria bacterium]|nr:aminotransferase class I/II-fold pyridoxal phosphate-dependent enzyme [Candidatus Wallbacteria bacterium]